MADRQVIIATAGHIDHGKSALVKALTGRDPDTLPEERERGMTIELGFCFLPGPADAPPVVFIDVPGHEKFVRTMVAGASAVDAALFVVAADEGPQEQSREHFAILNLLGVTRGVIAVTKSDLVDDRGLAAIIGKVRALAAGTAWADAPVVPVSARTGAGLDDLKSTLLALARAVPPRPAGGGSFRMPVDRVFTMKGFGAVVAGTVLAGAVRVGDSVELQPDGLRSRVRGIQVHGAAVGLAGVGMRAALNLQDLKQEQLRRGQTAAAPGTLVPTRRIDASLVLLSGISIKHRDRVRVHLGTDEVIARAGLLDRDRHEGGESIPVQLFLESAAVTVPGERFVLRRFSPLATLGGGTVLDANPDPHRRRDGAVLEQLAARGTEGDAAVAALFRGAGALTAAAAAARGGLEPAAAAAAIDRLAAAGELQALGGGTWLHREGFAAVAARLRAVLADYYARNRFRLRMPAAELVSRAGTPLAGPVLEQLVAAGELVRRGVEVGAAGYEPPLDGAERAAVDRVERFYRERGLESPVASEAAAALGVDPAALDDCLALLRDRELLVRLDDKVTYHREALAAATAAVARRLAGGGGVTIADLRADLKLSRKYVVAILEYLDARGVTRRDGDRRVPGPGAGR